MLLIIFFIYFIISFRKRNVSFEKLAGGYLCLKLNARGILVKDINNFSTAIHSVLKKLIEAKSNRDNIKFTSYQLANALNMPRSIITKLTHPDPSKRIINPKIETLLKIVQYFKSNGFDITIDDLLGMNSSSIDIQSQSKWTSREIQTISLYSLNDLKNRLGSIDVKLPYFVAHPLALYLEENIEPIFKIGSIFFVDQNGNPANNNLIAVKLDSSQKIQIKKYYRKKNKIILSTLNDKNEIILLPTQVCNILGVVVQINAKT